jgi:hypothetical protein
LGAKNEVVLERITGSATFSHHLAGELTVVAGNRR